MSFSAAPDLTWQRKCKSHANADSVMSISQTEIKTSRKKENTSRRGELSEPDSNLQDHRVGFSK
jgi:hypothetical protein